MVQHLSWSLTETTSPNSVTLTKEMSNAHSNAPHISFTILLAENFSPIITNIENKKPPRQKFMSNQILPFGHFTNVDPRT